MNHCLQCHQDYKQGDKHIFKCKTKTNKCSKCLPPEKQKLLKEIYKEKVIEINGAFGDFKPNIGYVKEVKDGETYFWGCTIPYRQNLDPRLHDSATALKRTLVSFLRLATKYPFLLLIRKKHLLEWFYDNASADFEKKIYSLTFSPMCDELYRNGRRIIEERFPIDDQLISVKVADHRHLYAHKVLVSFKALIAFFQTSNSYHIILQDILSELNKLWLRDNPRKELLRLFDLMISRIQSAEVYKSKLGNENKQFSKRFIKLRRVLSLLLLSPSTKKILKEYLMSLDMDKIWPDDLDRYYAYRRHNYDFEGKSYEERIRYVRTMDKTNNHIIFE